VAAIAPFAAFAGGGLGFPLSGGFTSSFAACLFAVIFCVRAAAFALAALACSCRFNIAACSRRLASCSVLGFLAQTADNLQ